MTTRAGVLGLLTAALLATPAVAGPSPAASETTAKYIVVLKDGVAPDTVASEHRRTHGAEVAQLYRSALKGYAARMPVRRAADLARDPRVAFVQPDGAVRAFEQKLPTGVKRVNASVSPTARIDGVDERVDVDVAVLDTGIDLDHPDLNVYAAGAKNCSTGTSADDGEGHGTHVAGTIGALDNASGVVGVAPGARLWPIRVLDDGGAGSFSTIICGIDYVTANADRIEVANLSLGGPGADDRNCGMSNGDAMHRAICRSVAAGVTYVVAAGNAAVDSAKTVPAAYDEVITVSALADFNGLAGGGAAPTCHADQDDTFASFSNYGGDVDIIAPGVCIYSTYRGGGYGTMSGTSMASPHVAGGAALYLANQPTASPATVKGVLQTAATTDWSNSDDPDGLKERLLNVAALDTAALDGDYVALSPARLMDTRSSGQTVDGVAAKTGALGASAVRRVKVTGRGGVPGSGVGAVVLNVTAVSPTTATHLTVFPAGAARPNASNLNVVAGEVSPNLVTVKVGTNGSVDLWNSAGSVQLLADVAGYFPTGKSFTPLTPGRLMDTRGAGTTVDGIAQGTGTLVGGEIRDLQVTGRYGIPSTGVGAVVLNVTGVAPTAGTHATVWPAGAAKPNASNLNLRAGEIKPNLVVAKVGAGGQVSFSHEAGLMNVVVDVAGWIPETSSYTPLTPGRLLDTRPTGQTVDGQGAGGGAVGAGGFRDVKVTGRHGIPASGVVAVVLNVTGLASPTAGTFATVFPAGESRPTASNLNLAKAEIRPNLVIAKVGANGTVRIYNSSGSTHFVADVAGWFGSSPTVAGASSSPDETTSTQTSGAIEATDAEPEATGAEPGATSAEPEATSAEPEATSAEPEATGTAVTATTSPAGRAPTPHAEPDQQDRAKDANPGPESPGAQPPAADDGAPGDIPPVTGQLPGAAQALLAQITGR
jgi:subtilisin